MRCKNESWKFDPVVERMRARVRFAVFLALLALLVGAIFWQAFSALLQPLFTALAPIGGGK